MTSVELITDAFESAEWGYMIGFRDYFKKNAGYLETQVGNPDGADKPNKKYYDPRTSFSPPSSAVAGNFCDQRWSMTSR